jgi:hypothetical protein
VVPGSRPFLLRGIVAQRLMTTPASVTSLTRLNGSAPGGAQAIAYAHRHHITQPGEPHQSDHT